VRTAVQSGRPRPAWVEGAAALAIYVVLWVLLVGRVAITDPAHRCVCPADSDSATYMWALVWWPHALVHGLNPFMTDVVWTPDRVSVALAAPAGSLLMWPVTAAFGPIVAFNVLSLLGPPLSAWFAFRLCRYVTGRWLPSLVGGYIFGFSSYVLAHTLGHLNLALVFLVPAAVHLVLLWLDDRVTARRFVLLMTGLLTLQFLITPEVLVTGLLFGAAALVLAYVFSPPRRQRLLEMVPKVLVAGALSLLLLAPFVYYGLKGTETTPSVNYLVTANRYSADPLNYLLPTPVTWVGHGLTESVAAKFNATEAVHANYTEGAAYIGLPLLVIVALFLFAHRRRASAKVALWTLALVFVASLGSHLHVADPPDPGGTYHPSIPLPWRAVSHLPLLDHVLPARLALFAFLIVAVIVAQWLAEPARWPAARWLLAGVGVLLLIPNQALPYWRGKHSDPAFFTGQTYRHHLKRDEIVVAIPYGWNGNSMLWQAQTDMYFRMAGGYLTSDVPVGYWREPVVRALLGEESGRITPERWRLPLRDFLLRRRVGAVILAGGDSDVWRPVVESLGLRPRQVEGVLFYDVSSRRRMLAALH
jgi:hypothetical protein